MTAIFTGLGAGFARGSGSVLGSAGLLGSASTGRSGENLMVNAATGNLVINRQDEFLTATGKDLGVSRIYNSLAEVHDRDNNDRWQMSTTRRLFGLTGAYGTAGSTIRRQAGDGSVTTFAWAARNGVAAYWSTDGDGAHDKIVRESSMEWHFTDGDSQFQEYYSTGADSTGSHRIIYDHDVSFTGFSYTYDAGDRLEKITATQSGEYVQYIYSGSNIVQINTALADRTVTRTYYTYDGNGRLSTVRVDLSPDHIGIADGHVYTTTYAYGANGLVSQITQTDGSRTDIAYDGSGRVLTLTEYATASETRITTFGYQTNYTTVTAPNGQVTRLDYAGNNLTKITAPPAYFGAAQQVQEFQYDAEGSLTRSIAPNGAITNYSYDTMGNLTLIDGPVGTNIERWYDARNRLMKEETYGSNESSNAVSQLTRFTYDSYGRLRYRVEPEGRVTEFRYNGAGLLAWTVEYTADLYTAVGDITEPAMDNWRDGRPDKTRRHLTRQWYDGRGNLVEQIDFAAADASGNASWDDGYTATYFTRDHLGRLVSSYKAGEHQESYTYDGLGRVVASNDASRAVTSVYFDDANTRTVIHLASGLNRTLTYNKSGDLISQVESALGVQTPNILPDLLNWSHDRATRTASTAIAGNLAYRYVSNTSGDYGAVFSYPTSVNAGETVRWRYTLKGDGTTSMHQFGLYGTVDGWGPHSNDTQAILVSGPGRLSRVSGGLWQIDGVSTTAETVIEIVRTFTSSGQTAAPHFAIGGTASTATGIGVILSAPSVVRTASDSALTIGATTSNSYDKLGRLRVSFDEFDNGNRTYIIYDNAGRKTAEINDYGHMTEFLYDHGNRLIGSVRYANGVAANHLVSTALQNPNNALTVAEVRPAAHAYDLREWTVYDSGGQVLQTIDGTGAVTAYEYDATGRVVRKATYATRVSTAGFAANPPSLPVSVTANAAIDSVTRTFHDRDGNVRGTLDGEGYLVEYRYDAAGNRIEEIRYPVAQSPGGTASLNALIAGAGQGSSDIRRTRFVYDQRGALRFQLDAHNRVTEFSYNVAGKLTSTRVYANAIAPASYAYASVKAAATAAAHANDRITTLVHDAFGRVMQSIDAANTYTYYDYDYAGNVSKVRHGSTGALEQITRNWYDARGNLRFSVDPAGYLRKYSYTVGGRLSTERLYDSAVSVSDTMTVAQVAALATGAYTEKAYGYDNVGRVVREVDGTGAFSLHAYYATGLLSETYHGYDSGSGTADRSTTAMSYDAAGHLTNEVTALGDSEQVTRTFEYSALGQGTRSIDGRTISSYAEYDRRGLVKTQTDGAGGVTTYTRNAFGEVSQVVDARGNLVLTNTYDTLGQLVSAVDPAGTTSYTYTRFGEVLTTTRGTATTSFVYDKMGRVKQITDALGFYETFTYNEVGDRISRVGKSSTGTVQAGGTTTYAYDRRGLKVSETLPMSSVNSAGTTLASTVTNTFAYDSRGNRITETRAAGLAEQTITGYEYDRANRLTKVVHPTFHGYATHTSYTYDARGNRTSETNPNGARTVYYYDDLDRVTAEINAVGTYTAYAYDPNGNVTSIKVYETAVSVPSDGGSQEEAPAPLNPSNFRETTFTYDNANRMLTSSVGGAVTGSYSGSAWATTTDAIVTQYQYDASGNVVKTTDPNGNATWAYYDALNRKTDQIDALGYRTRWTYDAEGNVTAEFRYATAGAAPTSVTTPPALPAAHANDRVTDYTYDKVGNRKTETRLAVAVHNGSGGTTSVSAQIAYDYNGLGQVTRKTEATGDAVHYTYDQAGRLTLETKDGFLDYNGTWVSPTVEYRYDGLGNLTRTREVGYSYLDDRVTTYGYEGGKLRWVSDAEANDGTSIDGKTTYYAYDAAGNVEYEYFSRHNSANTPAAGNEYEGIFRVYDGMGRVSQQWHTVNPVGPAGWTPDGPATITTYNAYGEVASVQVGTGALQENRYDKAGRLIGSNAGDGVWKYFAYDKAGNQTASLVSTGANTAGLTFNPATIPTGTAVTYTRYDARNLATHVHEPSRELSASATATLLTQRAYNAFGEVASETDAALATTTYAYNTMGRMVRSEGPTVSTTLEDGTSRWIKPAQDFYYDRGGRLVATRDANGTYAAGGTSGNGTSKAAGTGNLTKLTLLGGTGYGGSQALVREEHHADGGIKETRYDVHGDARVLIDELGRQTTQTFDQMGRVIQVYNVGSTLYDYYQYDGLGQQLKHWNSLLGSGNAEVTDYDVQGRVISKRAFGGDTTTSSYGFYASIGGFGGWQEVTTMANGRQQVEQTDIFGKVRYKSDLGGHVFNFNYDAAGRLGSMTQGSATQTYAYFNTGKLKSIALSNTGGGSTPTTTYGYDVMGNLASQSTSDAVHGTTQNLTASYDALGRMTSWTEGGNSTTPAATSAYAYDAKGNVRSVTSTFWYLDAQGAQQVQANGQQLWYRYDAMDRVVVSKGALSGGTIAGGTGISYNAAGQRATVTTYSSNLTWTGWKITIGGWPYYYDEQDPDMGYNWQAASGSYSGKVVETYTYTAAGQLDKVYVAGEQANANGYMPMQGNGTMGASVLRANFDYDAMGRLTLQEDIRHTGSGTDFSRALTYDIAGRIVTDNTSTLRGTTIHVNNTTNTYLTGTSNMLGAANSSGTVTYVNGVDSAAPDTSTTNTYVWWDSAMQSTTAYKPDAGGSTTYTTTFNYNGFAQLTSIGVADGRPRTVTLRNSADGQALRRDEADNLSGGDPHEVYYRMGGKQLGKTGNNGTAEVSYLDSTARRTATQGTGAFQGGLTYGSAYADFGLDYEAINSFSQGSDGGLYQVQAGDTLQGIAQSLWGDASLWYKLAEANGLSAGAALSAGRSLILPAGVQRVHNNASTFKPYDPAEVIGDTSPTTPKPAKKNKCGSFGVILLAVVAVAVATIVTAGAASVLSGQAFGGILGGMVGGTAVSGVGMGAWVAGGAIGGAVGSAASQGVGLATGIQDKFSWKGVAMAGIAGGIGGVFQGIGNAAGLVEGGKGLGGVGGFLSRGGVTSAVARGVVGNVAMQGIAVATGLQGKFSWAGVAAAGVGAAAGFGMGRLAGDSWGGQFASSTASAIANAATRSALTGESFGDGLRAAIPDVIGQALGSALAGALVKPSSSIEQIPILGNEDSGGLPAIAGGAALPMLGAGAQVVMPGQSMPEGPVITVGPAGSPEDYEARARRWEAVAKDPQYSEVAATNAAFNRHQADLLRQGQSSSIVLGDDGPLATVSDVGSRILDIKLPILRGNSINDIRNSADTISSYGTSFINWFSGQYNYGRDSIDRGLAGSSFQGYLKPYLYSADFVVAGVTTIGRAGVGIPSALAHPIDSAKGSLFSVARGIDAALVAENTPAIVQARNATNYLSNASGRELATRAGNLTGSVALTVSPFKLARAGRYSPTNTLAVSEKALAPVGVNRLAGNAFRDEIAEALRASGADVATEVYKRTPFGKRVIDIEVSRGGQVLGGVETKLGGSRYLPLQRTKDTWLKFVEGYQVVLVRSR